MGKKAFVLVWVFVFLVTAPMYGQTMHNVPVGHKTHKIPKAAGQADSGLPDFDVFDARAGYKVQDGKQVLKFSARIRNRGSGNATNVPVCLRVTDSQGFTKELNDTLRSLPSRRTVTFSREIANPRPQGQYTFIFTVNPDHTIQEASFGNNRITKKSRDVAALPDLTITGIWLDYNKKTSTIWWSVTVKNTGPVPALNIPLAMAVTSPNGSTGKGYRFIPGIPAGKTVNLHDFYTVHQQKGRYTFQFTANPLNTLAESNMHNNARSSSIKINK